MTGETISYRSHEPTLRVSTLQLLDRHHIDYSRWGLGGSKTVDQLIEELQQRESVLELGDDGELVRRVDGVGVDEMCIRDRWEQYALWSLCFDCDEATTHCWSTLSITDNARSISI